MNSMFNEAPLAHRDLIKPRTTDPPEELVPETEESAP